jgi:cytochrome c
MPSPFRLAAILVAALSASLIIQGGANAQDAVKGHGTFTTMCSGCHSDEKGGDDAIKLSLYGVVGRKAGSIADFSYSPAMTGSGVTWTPEQLDAYIASPNAVVPGTAMYFSGLSDPADRANLIAYLKTLK